MASDLPRIAILSDACDPPTNGVTRTFTTVAEHLRRRGHAVALITPPGFRTLPCPTDPGIRIAVAPRRLLTAMLEAFRPDAVHLATEGPLGLAGRRWCMARGLPFTTAFTTRFPEAIRLRLGVPLGWSWAYLRWFHAPSSALMVGTPTLQAELANRGFRRLAAWTRGVDLELFRPRPDAAPSLSRPVWLHVGRLAKEKNIEAFLSLDLPGTKLVVGDGPLLDDLRRRFPAVRFTGTLRGEALARAYAGADAFVFPSRTDTFGLVLLEALASGLPVAAYPVTGPLDVIGRNGPGVLDTDLGRAARAALSIPRRLCRAHAERFGWDACTDRFLSLLHPFGAAAVDRPVREAAAAR